VAPVAYVPLFTWTGCYLGANGGWIGGDEEYSTHYGYIDGAFAGYNTYSPKGSGGTFGGQFGCQFQTGSWVIGGEWDWSWSGLKEDNTYYQPFDGRLLPYYQYTNKQVDWFSTARARVGLAWDRILVYATGGLAYAGFDAYTHISPLVGAPPIAVGAYDEKRFGWTVGGGLEWAFANNWTAKAEFLYMDFGSFEYTAPLINNPTAYWPTHVDAKEYVARIGINYLFHTGGAPVVARY